MGSPEPAAAGGAGGAGARAAQASQPGPAHLVGCPRLWAWERSARTCLRGAPAPTGGLA